MFTENSEIVAPALGTREQATAFILAQPHGEYTVQDIRDTIVPAYFEVCLANGILPPQRNPAGIGVDGRKLAQPPRDRTNWAFNTQRQMWEFGRSFDTWVDDAIPAHVGRLLAYALAKDAGTPTQRALVAKALTYRALPDKMRGSAPILKQLGKAHNPAGQGWASPGVTYGARIAAIAQRIVQV
jgi:hypothetical protein